MAQLTTVVRGLIAHATASNAQNGICYVEVTTQYHYPSGLAGIYTGIVAVPVGCSDTVPDNWILPSSGILRYDFGQNESIKATFNLVARANEGQSFATLASFDNKITHTAQDIRIGDKAGLVGDMMLGRTGLFGKDRGNMIISYKPVKVAWGL